MTRFFNLAAAAAICGFAYLLVAGIAVPQAATGRVLFIVAAVALLVSIFAVAFALTAALRIRALRTDLNHLARSVDAALDTIAAERERDTASKATAAVAEQAVAEVREPDADDSPGTSPEQATNVVPHPATMRSRAEPPAPDPLTASPSPAIAAALKHAVASGSVEISLRPIVSTGSDGVLGFDVRAHLHLESSPSSDVWRARTAISGQTAAAAERLLVTAAVESASRPEREALPLHVAISDSLLGARDEIVTLVDLLKRNAGAARLIVLCLPIDVIRDPGNRSAVLARLAATGLRFAAEGWPQSGRDLEGLWQAGVSFVRLPAARLLAKANGMIGEPDTRAVLRALAKSAMAIVATEVDDAEDTAALASVGVTMMTSPAAAGAAGRDGTAPPRRSTPLDG